MYRTWARWDGRWHCTSDPMPYEDCERAIRFGARFNRGVEYVILASDDRPRD